MRRVAIVVLSFVALQVQIAGAVALSTCGQVIPEGTVAQLAADLDCDSVAGAFLGAGATIDLAGFTLRSGPNPPFGTYGVRCAGRCTILGPGSIEGFSDAVYSDQHSAIRVLGATIEGCHYRGIETLGHVILVGAVFFGNAGEAIYTGGPVTAKNTTFAVNGAGISGLSVKVSDSTFVGNGGFGVNADAKATVRRSSFTSNGMGMQGYQLVANDCTFDHHNTALNGTVVKVGGSQITHTALDGIDAARLRIFESSVTGSGSGCPPDPRFPCADLSTREMPVVVETTCDRSVAWQTHNPWGVCSLD